ncbi:hypothetical protein [Citrobacter amalonaticus]|uniref:hypothetical protein n=1 Tax=Citrobacter amalonaticus TaxID=35703 RepID=UPI00211B3A3A|nr:hypothetical protein [Citrobacter amalonaticus]
MTTITRFTKEQLITRVREKVKSLEFAVTQSAFADNRSELEEELDLARISLASLEAEPVAVNDDMAYAFHHALSDSSLGADEAEEIKAGLRAAFANVTAPTAPVAVPDTLADDIDSDDQPLLWSYSNGWNACRAAMLQGKAEHVSNRDELPLNYLHGHKDGLEWAAQLAEANHPQTGDWLYDDPTELAKAIRKGPDMPPVESGNSPVIPDEVLSAIRKVARIRTDLDDFDGDRRGIADCLDEAEQELIVTINEHAAMLQTGNDSTTGKPLTITLPDITSKAFWSGTGKSETFHPETYKRWVKEAIERACVITGIRVVVK